MKKINRLKNSTLAALLDDLKQMGMASFGDKLKEIILYGSYARDEQTHESDLDIMFLFSAEETEIVKYRDQIVDIMVELSLKYELVVSITESSINAFKSYIKYIPFYSNVYHEGVEIYAA